MKEVLLHLFQTGTDKASWYAPLKPALDGLTESQARWKPAGAQHSIAALTAHLQFYHSRELEKFRGRVTDSYTGDNDRTFTEPPPGDWERLVGSTFDTLSAWQKEIAAADSAKLAGSGKLIGEIAAHLAYHTGQIVLMRKWQQSWDPDKGVH